MRYLASLGFALALVACQRADRDATVNATTTTKVAAAPAAAPVAAPAPTPAGASTPAAAPAAEHAACGCGMSGGSGCAQCGGGEACGEMAMADDNDDKDDDSAPAPAPVALPKGTAWTALTVDGMHCGGCARRIQAALKNVDGIAAVDVDLASHTVKIAGAPGSDVRSIATPKIDALGYHVE